MADVGVGWYMTNPEKKKTHTGGCFCLFVFFTQNTRAQTPT
jgi:hypothetical protein